MVPHGGGIYPKNIFLAPPHPFPLTPKIIPYVLNLCNLTLHESLSISALNTVYGISVYDAHSKFHSYWKFWCWCCCLINLVSSEVPAQSSRIPNGVLHYSTYMIWLTWELSIRPEAARDMYDHRQALGAYAQRVRPGLLVRTGLREILLWHKKTD